MGLADASFSTIFVGRTLTEGTQPTTYDTITPTSHTLEPGADSFTSDDIDPNRKPADVFRTTTRGSGDIAAHWRPVIFDNAVQSALADSFSTAYNQTLTISFGTPGADGVQTVADDGTTGNLDNLAVGDLILIANATDSGNNGLKMVVVQSGSDQVSIYNPGGALQAGDTGIDIDNNGSATVSTTKSWLWVERMFSDGTNNIYSEFYRDALVGRWDLRFPAAGPSTVTFSLQGDVPTFTHADGSAPITKARGGSDNAASTNRLVHGMDDVREIIVYSPTEGTVILHDLVSEFGITLDNQIRQDAAVGTPAIINTVLGRSTLSGRANAFVNDVSNQTSNLVQYLADNPDDLQMFCVFGATTATAYGIWMDTVRLTGSPVPIGGNTQAVTINAAFSATDLRVTRI